MQSGKKAIKSKGSCKKPCHKENKKASNKLQECIQVKNQANKQGKYKKARKQLIKNVTQQIIGVHVINKARKEARKLQECTLFETIKAYKQTPRKIMNKKSRSKQVKCKKPRKEVKMKASIQVARTLATTAQILSACNYDCKWVHAPHEQVITRNFPRRAVVLPIPFYS